MTSPVLMVPVSLDPGIAMENMIVLIYQMNTTAVKLFACDCVLVSHAVCGECRLHKYTVEVSSWPVHSFDLEM